MPKKKKPTMTEQHVVLEIKALFDGEEEAKIFGVEMAKNIGIALQRSEQDRKIDHEFVVKIEINSKPVGAILGEPKDIFNLIKKAVMGQSPPKPTPPKGEGPEGGPKAFSA